MESYPSIQKNILHVPIYAYDKLDGSNIRAEWTRKSGFSKYGTRTRLLGADEEPLGEAIGLLNEKYAENLSQIFTKQRWEKATAFFEFHGPNSFAGFHEDEEHDVTLFDVHVYKKGLLEAKVFNKTFESVETAPILYHGNPTSDFIESVRTGTLDGMTFEGVICKGGLDKKRRPISFKVKNKAWLERLKDKCGNDEKMFKRLA